MGGRDGRAIPVASDASQDEFDSFLTPDDGTPNQRGGKGYVRGEGNQHTCIVREVQAV